METDILLLIGSATLFLFGTNGILQSISIKHHKDTHKLIDGLNKKLNKNQERKLLEDYERHLDNRILGKHNSRASKQLIDDYLANRNNT